MSEYESLVAALNAALVSFENLIAGEVPAASAALLSQRVKLVQAVNAYLAHVGRHAGTSGRSWQEEHEQLLGLRLRYSEHIARWSGSEVVDGWADYKRHCQALIRDMRAHLTRAASCPPLGGEEAAASAGPPSPRSLSPAIPRAWTPPPSPPFP